MTYIVSGGALWQSWQVFASWWKKRFFSVEKTGVAKIVLPGKNSFCHLNLRLLFFD